MNGMKFAPGPWKRAPKKCCCGEGHPNGLSISRVEDANGWPVAHASPRLPKGSQTANAQLIAAAPELYEALEDLMSAMDDVLYNADRVPDCIVAVAQDEMDKAKAALKKARGEF